MNVRIATWLSIRALRWMAWIAFFAVAYYIHVYRTEATTGFGQLKPHIELLIFGTGIAIVFLGFLELLTRERAGLPRPRLGELIPKAPPLKTAV
jgi:hypothetical protein